MIVFFHYLCIYIINISIINIILIHYKFLTPLSVWSLNILYGLTLKQQQQHVWISYFIYWPEIIAKNISALNNSFYLNTLINDCSISFLWSFVLPHPVFLPYLLSIFFWRIYWSLSPLRIVLLGRGTTIPSICLCLNCSVDQQIQAYLRWICSFK